MKTNKPAFVDIHNHGLWGVDDGIQTKSDAENMLQQAQNDGIKMIITTPHRLPTQTEDDFIEQVRKSIDIKKMALYYDIELYAGNEIYLDESFADIFRSYHFMTLGDSNYVLVEFDLRKDISDVPAVDDWLYEITMNGYRPVIAHVERYYKKRINIAQIKHWIEIGCYIQVNRTSCLKMYGEVNYDHAITLLDQQYVHVIASDAHQTTGNRICKMSDVYEMLSRRYGVNNANLLCCENPQRILHNKVLEMMQKRPSFIDRWRKR